MKDVKYIDTTGLMTLESIIKARQKLGTRVMLSAIHPRVFNSLRKFGILESVGSENVFAGTALAIESVSESGATITAANQTSTEAPGNANPA
jgi:anti-anti-sigma regulatory factor